MTAPLTGFTTAFPDDVVLDSGVLYVGTTVFGAFAGGLKFDPGITYRNIDFDGKRSPVKGLDRKTMMMPKISGTCIQYSTTNVQQVEPGATDTAAGEWTGAQSSYAPVAAGELMTSYLADVRALWLRGNGEYVQVRFPSAMVTKYDITSQDGAEIAIAIEVEARLDTEWAGYDGTGTAPYRIEYLATVNP
jgi:hypothetical protein